MQWLATDPAFAPVYKKAQAQIAAILNQAKNSGMAGFSQNYDTSVDTPDGSSVDITTGLLTDGSLAQTTNSPTQDLSIPTVTIDPSTANSAPATSTTPSLATSLSQLVGVAAQGVMTADQINTAQQINQIQLSRAQAGLPPLAISTGSLGLPQNSVITGTGILGGGSLLLIGGAALLLVLMLDKK